MNKQFANKENRLKRKDLDDFANCYFGRDDSPQPSAGDSVNRPYLTGTRHDGGRPPCRPGGLDETELVPPK
jgi:hypothetical protein